MESTFVSLEEVVEMASEAMGGKYRPIPGKRIMFEGIMANGESIVMCTPQSKLHPQGFYWVDITEVQYDVFGKYDNAILIFRLEGSKLMMINWRDLKPLLTVDVMRNNTKEGNHWKLNIFDDGIKAGRIDKFVKCESFVYTGKEH